MANQSFFYFAWANSSETTFNGGHLREDELIFAFELKHEEGQFAELEIEIINPRIGLLAPGRPLWAWFSWHDGTAATALFFGRLVGIPDDLFAEVIRLKFVAKPLDYLYWLQQLADSLKVLPFYDPLFIDQAKASDPDATLEAYSALWHVDRRTHVITKSDIIAGEDGVAEFTPNDVFYDSVKVKISGSPKLVCEIVAEVDWVQCDNTGVFEFRTEKGLVGSGDFGGGYTAEAGTNYTSANGGFLNTSGRAGGFTVKNAEDKEPPQRTDSWSHRNGAPGPHKDGDIMEEAGMQTIPFYGGTLIKRDEKTVDADPETGQGEEYSIHETYKEEYEEPGKASPPGGGGGVPATGTDANANTQTEIVVATELQQDRKEIIRVRVTADVQPVLTEATETDDGIKETLTMNARDAVEAGVASSSQGVYFSTDRGHDSVEYMLMIARAHLLAGSRVFETSWECPMSKVINLSCRMNATIEDGRLPGGIVLGKIVSYSISGDGQSGEFIGGVTINSAVGNGNAVTTAVGTPDYVDEGYVEIGYQHYSGRLVASLTNDMAFAPLAYVQSGVQIPVTADQVLIRHEYNNTGQASKIQELIDRGAEMVRQHEYESYGYAMSGPPQSMLDYAAAYAQWERQLAEAYTDNPSWVELEFVPIQGTVYTTEYDAEVSPLVIPMQVNLAAPSTA